MFIIFIKKDYTSRDCERMCSDTGWCLGGAALFSAHVCALNTRSFTARCLCGLDFLLCADFMASDSGEELIHLP